MEEEMRKCEMCSKSVPAWQIDPREGECNSCRANDRASDMTVGDLGGK